MILSRKYLVLIATLLSINYLTTTEYSYSQDYLEKEQKALNMIADFAERYCIDVPLKGSVVKRELSAKGKVQLDNLLKKIFDLEIGAGGTYEISEYSGILQKDLVDALENKSDCKNRILELLIDKFLDDDSIIPEKLPYVLVSEYGYLEVQKGADEETVYLKNVYSKGSKCIKDISNKKAKGEESPLLPLHIMSGGGWDGWQCARLLPKIWCFSRSNLLAGISHYRIECYLTEHACQRSLSFWNLPVRKDRNFTTPCEPHSSNEILARSKDFYHH